jgi:hypothetical protein
MTEPPLPEQMLVISRCREGDIGLSFGLKAGDMLIGLNGQPWRGAAVSLQAQILRSGRDCALSFQRGNVAFTVLSSRADLGQWRKIPPPESVLPVPRGPDGLRNWEIMADRRNNHDLFACMPTLLALVAPPVWLAQARLWSGLALFAAAVALCLPVGLPLVIPIWLAAGLHLWRDGAAHRRVALQMQGFCRVGIIAARSEGEAALIWQSLVPDAKFRFAPARAERMAASEVG